jgi:hypothetical protein
VQRLGGFSSANVIKPLILHWNGRRWSRQVSPQPSPRGAVLYAIAAASARDAWAVGVSETASGSAAFAIHCC